MARLGSMSSETFSSARGRISAASIGLGSILREQKAMPGAANRMTMLLGVLSSQTGPAASRTLLNSPGHSLASSPVESNGFLDVDDALEQKDEDIWEVDMCESGNSHHLDPLHRHRLRPHAYDHQLGSTHTYTSTLSHHSYASSQRHHGSHMHLTASKPHISVVADNTQFMHHLVADKPPGVIDVMFTHMSGSVRLSPLSKVSDSQPHFSHSHQNATPSQSIPRVEKHALYDSSLRAEHQSAPVNVPKWSKIVQNDDKSTVGAVNYFNSIEEVCDEDDDDDRLPPHEMLAREYARTQRMTASSMCEGQGRTLKGRDMRRVRNAVWRQTGFAD